MVEWYPHVLTVSTLHPISPTKTLNMVEFYYPEEIAAFERESWRRRRPPTWKPCIEDDEIGERMDRGPQGFAGTRAATTKSAPTRAPWGRRHAALSRAVPSPDYGSAVPQR